ncbi:MAG: molybdopterin molybdotransferase MoeA [Nitrososphaerota archaeon]|nr:molybdopterin molybdotransferase MoeA [Nitrososphaerota archaeon]
MGLVKLNVARGLIESLGISEPKRVKRSLNEYVGMVSAIDISAPSDFPPFDRSVMDGYAINMQPGVTAYKLVNGRLNPGEAAYIMTGQRVPDGCNAVIRVEHATVDGDMVSWNKEARYWRDVQRKGEDIRKGANLLHRGEIITPYHLSTLIMEGQKQVDVYDIAVGIIAIGDEIIPYESEKEGIRDSISPLISNLMSFARTSVIVIGDNRDEISKSIEKLKNKSDMIITIGGSSVGRKDLTKESVKAMGELIFEGVNVNVLKRGGVGMIDGKPLLILPGQVVSSVVVFHEHGLHILSKMVGRELRRFESVILSEDISVKHDMDSTYMFKLNGGFATPLRWGSGLYGELASADAFGILKCRKEYKKGEEIVVQKLIHRP